jgi:formylglycine-generating enzyme required for sulfatase activity
MKSFQTSRRGVSIFKMELSFCPAFFIALFSVLQGQSHAQITEAARIKCSEFGFKEKSLPFEQCVKQYKEASGSAKLITKGSPVITAEQKEDKFWDDAKSAGNREAFEAYLTRYPKGNYVGLARANITRLDPLGTSATTPTPAVVNKSSKFSTKDCATCPEMVTIPAGKFLMGSNDNPDEKPIHSVSLGSFLIGKTEVTQDEWRAVMGTNPSKFTQCGTTYGRGCPVENVSWSDAKEFTRKLSAKVGKKYRLPTEAEWEFAARAGQSANFYPSESDLIPIAWFAINGNQTTHLVAQKQPNDFGLFDMFGNVKEWVEDCYDLTYKNALQDGSVTSSICADNRRVLRGGSWADSILFLKPSFRFWDDRQILNEGTNGFRVVRNL